MVPYLVLTIRLWFRVYWEYVYSSMSSYYIIERYGERKREGERESEGRCVRVQERAISRMLWLIIQTSRPLYWCRIPFVVSVAPRQ